MSDIRTLINDIVANPEKINDLSEDQLIELQKKIMPYDTVLNPDDQRIFAMSYTNLREEYLTKFITTAMVAFMYRRMKEYCVIPHEDPNNKANSTGREIIKDFLAGMFEYDPDKHVQECAKVPKNKDEISKAKSLMEEYGINAELNFESAKGKNKKSVNFKNNDKESNGNNNDKELNNNINGNNHNNDKKLNNNNNDNLSESTLPKSLDLPLVPNDTFAWFRMYQRDNYEQLRWATMILYGILPDLELMIQPCEVFDNMDEYKVYEHMHRDALQYSITACQFGKWNILGAFTKNKGKISFLNKNTEILAQMLEQHKKDEQIGADLMKRRIKERKKENIRQTGPDAESLNDYLQNLPPDTMGASRLTKEEREQIVEEAKKDEKKIDTKVFDDIEPIADAVERSAQNNSNEPQKSNYNDDHNPPDDSVAVNVYTTGKKGLQKTHFFTESIAPDEEKELDEKRGEEHKKQELIDSRKRIEAEKKLRSRGIRPRRHNTGNSSAIPKK